LLFEQPSRIWSQGVRIALSFSRFHASRIAIPDLPEI